jgi:hypothetical protein
MCTTQEAQHIGYAFARDDLRAWVQAGSIVVVEVVE